MGLEGGLPSFLAVGGWGSFPCGSTLALAASPSGQKHALCLQVATLALLLGPQASHFASPVLFPRNKKTAKMAGKHCGRACVGIVALMMLSSQVQAVMVGTTCAGLGPQYFQSCIDDLVLQQQAVHALLTQAPPGIVGATCATVSPDYRRDCINNWIQQHLPVPGAVGGCGGVSPANRQGCLNSLVLELQQRLLAEKQQAMVGSTCSTVSPDSLQACINNFVMQLQAAEIGDNGGVVCDESDQACVDAYVLAMQLRSGVLGGCAGVGLDYRQACINNYVMSLQQKKGGGAQQQPAAVPVSVATATTSVTTTTSSASAVQVTATQSG